LRSAVHQPKHNGQGQGRKQQYRDERQPGEALVDIEVQRAGVDLHGEHQRQPGEDDALDPGNGTIGHGFTRQD
jgi:hypothetical protein